MKYYKRDSGTIVCVMDDMKIYYLNKAGKWINDQTLWDMFTDELDYEEISEKDIKNYLEKK